MKKFFPIILLGAGVIFLIVAFIVVRGRAKTDVVEEEENVAEVPFNQRPFTSLTPTEDGHWLKLIIENASKVVGAVSVDYEILYKVSSGNVQGVPGTVKITSDTIERDILLGSESSGKFRYDEGVEEGTLTLRFRNEKGKLTGKLMTEFHLQASVENLTSLDHEFSYKLDKVPKKGFFVVMNVFGLPEKFEGVLSKGPYGVFSSSKDKLSGKVDLSGSVYWWSGSEWKMLDSGKASDIGVFVGTSE